MFPEKRFESSILDRGWYNFWISLVIALFLMVEVVIAPVRVNIDPESKQLGPGDNLLSSVQLENVGLRGTPVDVELQMFIVDFNEKILFETTKEILAVEDTINIEREFSIPEDIPLDKYILLMQVAYENITADAFDLFEVQQFVETVEEKTTPTSPFVIILAGIIVILLIILFISIILSRHVKSTKGDRKKTSLLDVNLRISPKRIYPNEDMKVSFKFRNTGTTPDVYVRMLIVDANNKIYSKTPKVKLTVKEGLSIDSDVRIPKKILSGKYVLKIETHHDGKLTRSFDNFEVI